MRHLSDPERLIEPSGLLVPDEALEPDPTGPDLGDYDQVDAATGAWTEEPLGLGEGEVAYGAINKRPIVFYRDLRYRIGRSPTGRDVLAVSRALHQHGFRQPDPTMAYGWRMRDNVALFRRHQNMRDTGVYDQDTHRHLSPLFDSYGRWLYSHQDHQPAPPSPDERIGRLMHSLWACYAMRPWAYRQLRPFMLYPRGQRIRYTYDCSWFFKQVYYMSGLPSPDADGYAGGYGNTESLRAHGRDVAVPEIRPGDAVFYGYWGSAMDPAHVAMASGNGMVIGFGSTGGPRLSVQDYRVIHAVRRYF